MGYPAMKGVEFLASGRAGRSMQIRNQGNVGGCPEGSMPLVLHFQGAGKWLRPQSGGKEAAEFFANMKNVQKAKDPLSILGAVRQLSADATDTTAALGQFRSKQ